MTGTPLTELLSIAGPSIGAADPEVREIAELELRSVLTERNGFYAFDSALHVFPTGWAGDEVSIEQWNAPALWCDAYGDMTDGLLFFAEDAFGVQFALHQGAVVTFDPESGETESVARSLEGWASAVLEDFDVLTGFRLAHEWQCTFGRIPARQRLVPKVPFVVGGEFQLSNLYLSDAMTAMRFRGELAAKMRDLPDGTRVRFRTSSPDPE